MRADLSMPAHARLMRQPGPVAADRFATQSDCRAVMSRITLAPGLPLVEAISAAVAAISGGARRSAALTLLSGSFAPCVHCLAAPDPSGERLATYTPFQTTPNVEVLGGAATLGEDLGGDPMVHCHAWFISGAGSVAGGHLDTEKTCIGPDGLVVLISVLGLLRIRQVRDMETNHAIFSPMGHFGVTR